MRSAPGESAPGEAAPGAPPALDQIASDLAAYQARLADVAYWAPYVAAVLARHGLPDAPLGVGDPGTFPTFLAGAYAVKLFGPHFGGAADYATERAVYAAFGDAPLGGAPPLPVPRLVAAGHLVEHLVEHSAAGAEHAGSAEGPARGGTPDVWAWPCLVTTRASGVAWRAAAPSAAAGRALARELGVAVRAVHALPPPAALAAEKDPLAALRATCATRHRAWGTLPPRLVAEIPEYVAGAPPTEDRRLVHADLHADHLFVDVTRGARLTAVIDWADALVCDPCYELPALHLDTFGGRPALLGAFLDGYGWDVGPDFARRAMAASLLHRFDVWEALARTAVVRTAPTLDALAARVWAV